MSWWRKVTSAGVSTVVDSTSGLVGTVFGDKAAREDNQHSENMAVHGQHAAEYQYRGRRTWFDSLVDGANRLVRPMFTYGNLAIFGWATWGSKDFLEFTARLATIPDQLWIIQGTILAFWFGSRSIFKDSQKFKTNPGYVQQVYESIDKIREIQRSAEDQAVEETEATGNQTIDAFNKSKREPSV